MIEMLRSASGVVCVGSHWRTVVLYASVALTGMSDTMTTILIWGHALAFSWNIQQYCL